MVGSFDALPPRRSSLLGPDGQWNRAALAAWLQDLAAFKAAMPDDSLAALGPRAGDLLITDDAMEFVPGGLVMITDEELFVSHVGPVRLDSAGRCCFDLDGDLVPIDHEDAPRGLAIMVVGYLPMHGSMEQPKLFDLVRAIVLPAAETAAESDRPITGIDPSQLPY